MSGTKYIAYRTNNKMLEERPCGMNDIVYMDNKLPTPKQIASFKQRAKNADYDYVVLFKDETEYSFHITR